MSQLTLNPPIRNNFYAGAQSASRLYVRPNVFLPDGEIDFQTGMIRQSERRVGRTQALRRESRQLDTELVELQAMLKARESEKGIRMPLKAAVIMFVSVLFIFSVVLLAQQGNIVAKQDLINQINDKIEATQTAVNDISAQLETAMDPVQICYTAARDLDMVPAESAQAIYLTALSTRPNQAPIAIRAGSN